MKIYTIPEYGIKVKVIPKGSQNSASIKSELRKHLIGDGNQELVRPSPCDLKIIGAVDALESLILGHACAGLDISSPAYEKGLKSCLEALANHYDY